VVGERTRITRGGNGISSNSKNPADRRTGGTNRKAFGNGTSSEVLTAIAILTAHMIMRMATPICISAAGHGYTAPSAKGVKTTSTVIKAVRIQSSDRNRPLAE
jgi:hypothetical protein